MLIRQWGEQLMRMGCGIPHPLYDRIELYFYPVSRNLHHLTATVGNRNQCRTEPSVGVEIPTRLGYQRAMDDMPPWLSTIFPASNSEKKEIPTIIHLRYSSCFNRRKLPKTHVEEKISTASKVSLRVGLPISSCLKYMEIVYIRGS